jgi:hypothetical protein
VLLIAAGQNLFAIVSAIFSGTAPFDLQCIGPKSNRARDTCRVGVMLNAHSLRLHSQGANDDADRAKA